MKKDYPFDDNIIEFLPALRVLLSEASLKTVRLNSDDQFLSICADRKSFEKGTKHFSSEFATNWDGSYIFVDKVSSPEEIITSFIKEFEDFRALKTGIPKIIAIKGYGVIGIGEDSLSADNVLDELTMVLKGSKKRITIPKESSQSYANQSILNKKICIVTGGAQGFGEGIARSMILDGANLVIADLNEEKGNSTTLELKTLCGNNDIIFVKTDISNPDSVKNLVCETVRYFGGIDVFVSNAGILKAGGLDEMDPSSFDLMTKINYSGYFLCAKYASVVMKLQSKYNENYYSDIIQINSKSGLKGSNRNFAYAGGKFGGIGLTQSFALELAPYRIKVNAICPGNFFEGPLWADPDNGLFVQYLKAGKVPGAKTIQDVKRFYEKQVPLGRGCSVEDVMKALKYIVIQEYETGQAIPVTGGQEMVH